jgi:hypothetical protein
MGNQPDKFNLNINLDNCPEIVCPCGAKDFVQLVNIRILPAVYSPSGKTGTVNIAKNFACTMCGKVMDTTDTIKQYEDKQGKIITMPSKGETK